MASQAAGETSGGEVGNKKKVYDRVLLWMLDMKSTEKTLKISPLVEVG